MIDSKRTSVRFFCQWVDLIWRACFDRQCEGRAQSVALVQVCGVSRADQFLTQ